MLLSMTGFASKEVLINIGDIKVSVTMNLKSLNSRFFESSIKLPMQLNHLETKISKHLKKKLHRGKVYLTMLIDHDEALKSEINASTSIVNKYIEAIDKIKKSSSISGELSVSDICRLPYVFNVEEKKLASIAGEKIIEAIDILADDLVALQKEEGLVILADLQQRVDVVDKEIELIKTLSKENIEQHKDNYENELKEISKSNPELSDTKQAILYQILDKIDIHEETVLFKSYADQLKKVLVDKNIEKGKRLSFTLQELNREINTISAKCSNVSIGKHTIVVKVELEKMREQAQNVL